MENYGINTFHTLNVGGHIKEKVEDFIAQEVRPDKTMCSISYSLLEKFKDALPKERKDHLRFTLVKKNWTTNRAIKKLSDHLRVSRKRFSFAGTKDKRAITAQRASVWNVRLEALKKITLKDITVKNFDYAEERLHLGELYGNRFTITVRDANNPLNITHAKKLMENGIRNYFGPQRFGILRPNNHLIGKELIRGHFEEAAKIFITLTGDRSSEERKFAARHWGEWGKILKIWPDHLGVEAALLNYLVQHPNDYANAFRQLPKNLLRLFVHAVQSYVFNLALSQIEDPPTNLPLVGYSTQLKGEAGALIKKILKEEEISRNDFRSRSMPELATRGTERPSKMYPKQFKVLRCQDDLLTIRFVLKKGRYATIVLMKLGVNIGKEPSY